MTNRICPSCKKKVDEIETVCPKCGAVLFDEPIEVNSEKIEQLSENTEKNSFKSLWNKFIEKVSIKSNARLKGIKEKIKNKLGFICSRVLELLKKFCKITRLYKLRPYITYVNVLAVITLIGTICMVATGIKIVRYKDNTSTLCKVNADTTYYEIKDRQEQKKKEGSRSLDLQRGVIILTYENEKIGGVDVTLKYEMKPGEDVITKTVIVFKHNDIDITKMRHYLEVNYGMGKKQEDGTISYEDEECRYSYTNGTCTEVETVEIVSLD